MKVYFACLDIEKANDRVDRKVLCEVLRHIGIDVKVVNTIWGRYEYTKAHKLGELETGWVMSVRQGCTLCPTLFGLYTD